jgi:hypothetical protein
VYSSEPNNLKLKEEEYKKKISVLEKENQSFKKKMEIFLQIKD